MHRLIYLKWLLFKHSGNLSFNRDIMHFVLDPVGSSAPQLPTRNRAQNFAIPSGVATTLMCEAQGSPTPSFR